MLSYYYTIILHIPPELGQLGTALRNPSMELKLRLALVSLELIDLGQIELIHFHKSADKQNTQDYKEYLTNLSSIRQNV